MDERGDRRSWGVEQRIEFIEFKLFWDGQLNRSDITERFGVSTPQASADLANYQDRVPGNLRYDSSRKCYLPAANFKPLLLKPNAERYLAQLRALTEKVIGLGETWIEELPDTGSVPIPSRRVDAASLRKFLAAIRERRSISIEYQSLSDTRPDPTWREITPHAFGSDGLRWHVRAFCHIEQRFKDFILSRCLKIGRSGEPQASGDDDTSWRSFFTVILMPNPKLSPAQQKTIERDYGMKDGRCELNIRRALLYYLDKRLRLDIAEKQDRPKETPVVVANRKEYDQELKSVSY
ncbi:MAG: WYL domain-containing protein [Xanthobacteraceae bacterium]|nr:WYL domain-containing protein [Xanthobacteraceae bacterium]